MVLINNIPYFKKQKEQLQQDIQILEQNKTNIERSITILQQANMQEQDKQNKIKLKTMTLQEENKQLEKVIEKLNKTKNNIDEMIDRRETFYINTEIQHINNLNGLEFERYCSDLLKKLGYKNVEVTKPSGDEGGDILAEKNNLKYVIQCKRYNETVGNKAIQEVYTAKGLYKCDKAIVLTNNVFTKQAKKEANMLDIDLWDKDKIKELLYIIYDFDIKHIDFIDISENNINNNLDDVVISSCLLTIKWILENNIKTLKDIDILRNIKIPLNIVKRTIVLLQELGILSETKGLNYNVLINKL